MAGERRPGSSARFAKRSGRGPAPAASSRDPAYETAGWHGHVFVAMPGEDRADFEAERRAFFDEWRPATHTRAVLVERAVVASWRLRRAVRSEAARLVEVGADVAHDFDLAQREAVEGPTHRLGRDPG